MASPGAAAREENQTDNSPGIPQQAEKEQDDERNG